MLSKEEIEKISNEYYKEVHRFCLYYCKKEDVALDLTQETFATLLKKKDSLENINIKSWLMSTARLLFLKYIEKYKKERSRVISIDENYEFIEALASNIERKFITEITQQHIDMVFSKLKKNELMLYEMYYDKNMSYSEISKKLGVKENALYARMSRLKDKVEKIIEEDILFI